MPAIKATYTQVKKKAYLWVTLGLFLLSVLLHWLFGWQVYKEEQLAHQEAVQLRGYITQMLRDTMENWQSEFLQLMWQVAGLSFLWYVGSPQSKESEERKEEKIDHLLKQIDPDNYQRLQRYWNEKYPKK